MRPEDRQQAEDVLTRRISRDDRAEFLSSESGDELRMRIELVRGTLSKAGLAQKGPPPRPVAELLDIHGARVLSDPRIGP